mmetsp:Transcript_65826/g.143418  ORF Transcript_65826/g.143418 Transcript_65826/m.143418 type:complete len:173 (+) Transcript_65826:75-593(+)
MLAAKLALMLVGAKAAVLCPDTPAWLACGVQLAAIVEAACDEVLAEMKARVAGQSDGSWEDPHNRGTYSLQTHGGTFSTSRLTGDGKYTDKQIFRLEPAGSACKIEACSRSQVFSVFDFGTNYCNLKMLYCGSQDGCKPVHHDFTVASEIYETFSRSSVDLSLCIKAGKQEV